MTTLHSKIFTINLFASFPVRSSEDSLGVGAVTGAGVGCGDEGVGAGWGGGAWVGCVRVGVRGGMLVRGGRGQGLVNRMLGFHPYFEIRYNQDERAVSSTH